MHYHCSHLTISPVYHDDIADWKIIKQCAWISLKFHENRSADSQIETGDIFTESKLNS
jgi:hypothetical protein